MTLALTPAQNGAAGTRHNDCTLNNSASVSTNHFQRFGIESFVMLNTDQHDLGAPRERPCEVSSAQTSYLPRLDRRQLDEFIAQRAGVYAVKS